MRQHVFRDGRALTFIVLLLCLTQNVTGQQTGSSFVIQPPTSSVRKTSVGIIPNDLPRAATATVRRLEQLPIRSFAGKRSLEDFVEQLNEVGVPTIVNWHALDEEDLSKSDKIEIPRRLSLPASLQDALDSLDLAWTVSTRGKYILITSQSDLNMRLLTVTYDITPLVASNRVDPLIHTVTSTVAPDSWDDVGGTGAIEELEVRGRRLLIISNSYHNQLRVSKLLNSLHRFGGPTTSRPANSRASQNRMVTASQPIAMPARQKKRGINLPNSGSMSGMGGMGPFGGGFGGMF